MRVITGLAKGRRLQSPSTLKVRPATDKVKGAIFNILGDITGARSLDLFAGSGSVGIEALSRAASFCCFVESDKKIARFIQKNLETCRLEDQGKILSIPVRSALKLLSKKKEAFDLIFIDPPYDKGWVNTTLKDLTPGPLLKDSTLLVIEHSPREIPQPHETLEIFDQRKYGQTLVSFLRVRSLLTPHPLRLTD